MQSESLENVSKDTLRTAIIVLVIVCLVALALLVYFIFTLNNERSTFAQIRTEQEEQIDSLSKNLLIAVEENDRLREALMEEEEINRSFEDQISDISGVVGDLDKLAKTDEELLQKYSKVYFLNEHYVPSSLSDIDEDYTYQNSGKTYYLHSKVLPFLEDMVEDAEDDGIDLQVISAYRAFGEQGALKSGYTVTYGEGANTFSADQGYSEHQLGTTVDFTTPLLGANFETFGNTKAYEWLADRAHRYGFVLSYPEGNAFYIHEPWHWRFVGTDLARDLHQDDEYFYDWDQRNINEYLISIFD